MRGDRIVEVGVWRKLRDDTLDEVRVEALAERRGVEARAFTLAR